MVILQDLLKRNLTKINDIDSKWRNFVKDFRNQILLSVTAIELSSYQELIFRYRLRDLLYEANYSEDIAWVVVWINDMKNECDFKDKEYLLLPDYNLLTKIRNLYDGSKVET